MSDPTIRTILDQLDKDRNLPAFRLEPAAAPIFGLFLIDVLEDHYKDKNFKFSRDIIPEFPLRHGTLGTNKGKAGENQSVKVDYAAFTNDHKKVFFVELKTDCGSVSSDQAKYLKKAKELEFRKLVRGIDYIIKNKKTKQIEKYSHLWRRLSDLRVLEIAQRPEIVYVLPKRTPECTEIKGPEVIDLKKFASIITFEEFAGVVKNQGEIGKRFAKSLERWAKHPAGTAPPGAKGP